jgi:hypothetical protein
MLFLTPPLKTTLPEECHKIKLLTPTTDLESKPELEILTLNYEHEASYIAIKI